MKRNHKLFSLTLLVIIIVASTVVYLDYQNQNTIKPNEEYKPGVSLEKDRAVNQAKAEFIRQKNAGIDFTDGPCLTNDLMTDWAADIAYKPRKKSDNLEINQCKSYIEGRVKHFVELTPEGEVIRVK